MDGSSYANCNGDKAVRLSSRKYGCLDEWVVLVIFFFCSGNGKSIVGNM